MIVAIYRPIAIAAAGAWLCSAAFAADRVAPESPIAWQVDKHPFGSKRSNEAFSGFACGTSGMCVLAVDEGRQGAFMRINGERLVSVGKLFEFDGVEKELDAEAAAVDGGYFYVAGSHAAKRETCCDNSDSRRVYRLTADENGHIGTMAHSERLWDAMRGLPELASYAVPGDCRCDRAPGRNRIDIEGMATANGRLFFALRAPNVDGSAYIVSVDARALFEGGDLRPSLATVRLGANKGFRDLAIADGEALALVGPSDAESPADYSIVELRGLTTGVAVQPRELAALDLQNAPLGKKGSLIKPEAIAVLELNPRRYRLLVLSDGGDDGAPLVFNIPRKP
ncbi:DUF3616 domain-containing protein [Methylocystis sp. L43]|jgi:hypothetical protein|uniref:DUF3616 domain-containing protein n=1 Tax=unclassified Methylocystis TaxID=2625913 RepID=UPI0018C250D7|nr:MULTISPECIES: DUF3616 domain-containing protein [unclassified Methylocystis]MBG0799372.1 DUF3616 domain-containing protein [Methylocystis sp. L43]MBG0807154.1 DUF3616 domain-containing protein [Methylocystis sp. H15]